VMVEAKLSQLKP